MSEAGMTARPPGGLRICLLAWPRLVLADGVEHTLERKDAALLALLAMGSPHRRQSDVHP